MDGWYISSSEDSQVHCKTYSTQMKQGKNAITGEGLTMCMALVKKSMTNFAHTLQIHNCHCPLPNGQTTGVAVTVSI